MALRVDFSVWHSVLLAAAGLLPLQACGGTTTEHGHSPDEPGGTAGVGGSDAEPGGSGGSAGMALDPPGETGGTGGTGGTTVSTVTIDCSSATPQEVGYEQCGRVLHRTGPAQCAGAGSCVTDADCPADSACVCATTGSACARASCSSDADCSTGELCVSGDTQCGQTSWHDVRCVPARMDAVNCATVGRPFLVGGAARVATLQQRADWLCEDTTPDLSGLSRGAREALSEHYRKAALLEHASVAAFSRFVMDLLSVGAPADLVEEAGRAMLDESAHARLCFGLACGFSGTALGPSPLSVQDSLDRRTLKEIVVTTVLEGCVGETIAAMEAVEALAHATDPAVRRALSRIAEDELRHAALAYRFVDWAISHFGPQVQEDVRGTFQAALTSQAPEPSGSRLAVPSHGLLSPAHRRELRARALRELVAPTLPALFAA